MTACSAGGESLAKCRAARGETGFPNNFQLAAQHAENCSPASIRKVHRSLLQSSQPTLRDPTIIAVACNHWPPLDKD